MIDDDLEDANRELDCAIAVLEKLRHKTSPFCFCQVSLGNPMFPRHTEACKEACAFMERNKPTIDRLARTAVQDIEDDWSCSHVGEGQL